VRMIRQDRLVSAGDPIQLFAVIDEPVLYHRSVDRRS
jgi:hypothetical protein